MNNITLVGKISLLITFITDEEDFLEELMEFLGDNDIVTLNELDLIENGDCLIDSDRNIYFLTKNSLKYLKKYKEVTLPCEGKLADFVDTTNEEHINAIMWYYSTDKHGAVREMYSDCGWIQTDGSWETLQYYKEIEPDEKYIFREHRWNGEELELFEEELIYSKIDRDELVEACLNYAGNFNCDESNIEVTLHKLIDCGEEIPLMLECYFEQM